MPRQSKIQISSTKPKNAVPEEQRNAFYCCRCGKKFSKQRGNFPASQSSLYRGNGGYLSTCNHCIDELYEHYRDALGSEMAAIQRICLKFDIYWSTEIYAMLGKTSSMQSRVKSYISKSNLIKFIGKTYDDTLDEQSIMAASILPFPCGTDAESSDSTVHSEDCLSSQNEFTVTESIVNYWGSGFTPQMYAELENRRAYWLSQYPAGTVLNPGEEGILRQICNLEIDINHDRAAGKSVEKSISTLNTLFGSMNIKPSQRKDTEENYIPFGCEIARFEEEHPIIEPDEDFKDVDGIHKNVITWFLGSLCRTAGIKNEYSDLFEKEIQKYTVERPTYDYDDDDDDTSEYTDNLNSGGTADGEIHT